MRPFGDGLLVLWCGSVNKTLLVTIGGRGHWQPSGTDCWLLGAWNSELMKQSTDWTMHGHQTAIG